MDANIVEGVAFNMIVQIVLILLIFILMYIIGWKPFLKYLKDRQKAAVLAFEEAEKQKNEANEIVIQTHKKIEKLNIQSAQMIANAEKTAKKIIEQQRENVNKEVERKRTLAEKQIQIEQIRMEEKMQQRAVELASQVAAEFLTSKATDITTEEQIDAFLKKMGDE
jgi:F0F1-type ATP synthase, subunit b